MKSGTSPKPPAHKAGRAWSWLLALVLCILAAGSARGDTQFDVFLGYGDLGGGGLVPEATWFPAVCEIKNEGPTFTGYIEISAGNYGESQSRRVAVELPTGTRKRISILLFASGRYSSSWDFRLVDERGRLRAERSSLGARSVLASGTVLMGALPRSSAGTPVIRTTQSRPNDLQPTVARFVESAILPDNPLVWEGMSAFYLNSEKAPDLTADQAEALLAWLNNGGRLIVAVDAVGDVNGTPWLKSLLPVALDGTRTVTEHREIEQWLRSTPPPSSSGRARLINGNNFANSNPFASLADDSDFERTELVVATGTLRKGSVLASSGGTPLMVTAREGRGTVTVLLFDPERDPTRSWKNLPTMWARLAGVPAEFYANENQYPRSSSSIDGVFGAMVDSKQVRKLPVEWLLLLLIVYLAVIGPLDQYWLKRIKRPMLTWLTFPCYVVIFSMMIYLIGYKLRAGETEWNELHLVDVLPRGDAVEMRGRSYFSIYSPVNATYQVASQQAFSAFRGESAGSYGTSTDDERATVSQDGENYKASIFVPVWTSQLYASDWWEGADPALKVNITPNNNQGWSVTIDNRQPQPLATVRLAIAGTLYDLGAIPAGQTVTNQVTRGSGQPMSSFVQNSSRNFKNASDQRRHTFGSSSFAQLDNLCDSTMAISLLGVNYPENAMNQSSFVMPPGLDLSPDLDQGEAILLAWEPGAAPTKPVNQFPTRRSHKDTLWRVIIPLNQSATP